MMRMRARTAALLAVLVLVLLGAARALRMSPANPLTLRVPVPPSAGAHLDRLSRPAALSLHAVAHITSPLPAHAVNHPPFRAFLQIAAVQAKRGASKHSSKLQATAAPALMSAAHFYALFSNRNFVNFIGGCLALVSLALMFLGKDTSRPMRARAPRPSLTLSTHAVKRPVFPSLSSDKFLKLTAVASPEIPNPTAVATVEPKEVVAVSGPSTSIATQGTAEPTPDSQPHMSLASPEIVLSTPARPSLLQRLFSRPASTSARAQNLKLALRADDSSADCRLFVASYLSRLLPSQLARIVTTHLNERALEVADEPSQQRIADFVACSDDEDALHFMVEAFEQAGLAPAAAAEVFADVVNALVVHIVDVAAAALDARREEDALRQLDALVEFIGQVAPLFGRVFPGTVVAPVEYNGYCSRKSVEQLFGAYLKSTMDVPDMLALMQGGGEDGTEQAEAEARRVRRSEGLAHLQFLFSIKDGKRTQIEQRIVADMVLSMGKQFARPQPRQGSGRETAGLDGDDFGGAGRGLGMGDLSELQGLGGLGEGLDGGMEHLGKMLERLPAGALDNVPDMSKMDPSELAQFSQQTVDMMKQALEAGQLGAKEVAAFEQMMGTDVEALVSALDRPEARGNAQAQEIVQVFQQLVALKQRGQ